MIFILIDDVYGNLRGLTVYHTIGCAAFAFSDFPGRKLTRRCSVFFALIFVQFQFRANVHGTVTLRQ